LPRLSLTQQLPEPRAPAAALSPRSRHSRAMAEEGERKKGGKRGGEHPARLLLKVAKERCAEGRCELKRSA